MCSAMWLYSLKSAELRGGRTGPCTSLALEGEVELVEVGFSSGAIVVGCIFEASLESLSVGIDELCTLLL
nr:hypothetical protein CFP56_12053 [Quercus suber]